MTRLIFVTGGVISSLGKGIASASIANLLEAEGYSVLVKKIDPYLNIDPGTMNPIQHGEVFVTDDGGETDLDLGHYERFTHKNVSKAQNITAGKIYQTLLQAERKGEYAGQTIQVVPHVVNLIKNFYLENEDQHDFVMCEIGGTTGDIEGQPFLEAIRQLKYEFGDSSVLSIHLTYLPYIEASNELKTKPTQHSVRELMSYGITPNILLCRTSHPLQDEDKRKISSFCNVPMHGVIEALDVQSVYEVPLRFYEHKITEVIRSYFKLEISNQLFENNNTMKLWRNFVEKFQNLKETITITIIGKYTQSVDSYKSITEALIHSSVHNNVKVQIQWVDARKFSKDDEDVINDSDGIIVAGGFGIDGAEGKISAIKLARENKIPFLGICLGMQLATIEFARNVMGIKNADSSELLLFGEGNGTNIVGLLTEWYNRDGEKEQRTESSDLGGTMRLGLYKTIIKPGTLAERVYNANEMHERHRHRYEVNGNYVNDFQLYGGIFSGMSPDGLLPEMFEITKYKDKNEQYHEHPYFISTQSHPELSSKPFVPSKLFCGLVKAASENARRKGNK